MMTFRLVGNAKSLLPQSTAHGAIVRLVSQLNRKARLGFLTQRRKDAEGAEFTEQSRTGKGSPAG